MGRHTRRDLTARLQLLAQGRADEQGRRVPWRQLLEVRKQYVDWQMFYLWVRSILDIEQRIPDWLDEILDQRCPGFVPSVTELTPGAAGMRPLPVRLEDWIDEHVFGFAKDEGWFDAVQFYAVRDPRYQRAEVCWSECVRKWAPARPIRYPSFEEWQAMAASCDETAHLIPEQRKAQASARLVHRERLEETIARYIDWEAFVYWARPGLAHDAPIPDPVREELEHRCPGFLVRPVDRGSAGTRSSWKELMVWIGDQFFGEAKAEGWFDAILVGVRRHPRTIRTMEYANHCDRVTGSHLPQQYPLFDDWRRDADAFVERETD